jgi:hypothetical protein
MDKTQLSNIISEALCRYPWSSSITLPDYLSHHITNAIDAERTPNDAIEKLRAENERLKATIAEIRAVLP